MNNLRSYAEEIEESRQVKLVLLFGSLARGDYTGSSDADLLIVAEEVPERFIDRIPLFLNSKLPISIQPIVYREEEIRNAIRNRNPFILTILREGILLTKSSELFKDLCKENQKGF